MTDGTQVKDLNKLISAAKGFADNNPQMFPNRQPANLVGAGMAVQTGSLVTCAVSRLTAKQSLMRKQRSIVITIWLSLTRS